MTSLSHGGLERDGLGLKQFKEEYARVLKGFAAAPVEEQLLRASELGKKAQDSDIGLLDMTAVHMSVLAEIIQMDDSEAASDLIDRSERVLLESLSAFDISAKGFRDKLKEARQKSEEDVRALFSSAQDGVLLFGNAGVPLDFNKAFADMLGYTRIELKELTSRSAEHSTFTLDTKAVAQLLEKGHFDEYETQLARSDGSQVVVTVSGAMIGGSREGSSWRAFAFVKDITD